MLRNSAESVWARPDRLSDPRWSLQRRAYCWRYEERHAGSTVFAWQRDAPALKGMLVNFIEQIFGVTPDRGDGSLELMPLSIIFILASALVVVQLRRTEPKP